MDDAEEKKSLNFIEEIIEHITQFSLQGLGSSQHA